MARTTVGGGIIATHFRDIWFSPGAPFPHFNVGTSERFFFRLPQVAGNIVNVEMGERGGSGKYILVSGSVAIIPLPTVEGSLF